MITARRRETLAESEYRLANIGSNYWTAEVGDIPEAYLARKHVVTYCRTMVEFLKTGTGLTLIGTNGHGKTHIAVICLKEAMRHAARCLFLEAAELASATINRDTLEDDPKTSLIGRAKTVDMLVIDDLGSEHGSEFGRRIVEGLIRLRSNKNRSTILTTNLTGRELTEQYGASLKSIMSEKNLNLMVQGVDWRKGLSAALTDRFVRENS